MKIDKYFLMPHDPLRKLAIWLSNNLPEVYKKLDGTQTTDEARIFLNSVTGLNKEPYHLINESCEEYKERFILMKERGKL
jgi:hypothetical protein